MRESRAHSSGLQALAVTLLGCGAVCSGRGLDPWAGAVVDVAEEPRHACAHDHFVAQLYEGRDPEELRSRREGHARLNGPATRAVHEDAAAARRLLQAPAEPQPIRFKAIYQWQGLDANFETQLENEVMPRAMFALRRALRLRAPVPGTLKLPRFCQSSFVDSGECTRVGDICGARVELDPLPEDYFGDFEVCSSPGNCETTPGGAGIPDADFAVIVTAQPSAACGPSTGAHAVHCVTDTLNWYGLPDRPLAGYINFCPLGGGSIANEVNLETLVDTAVHELIHTLFMSSTLFDKYIDASGNPDPLQRSGDLITSRSVAAAAQQHFGCPTFPGAPLEDEGGLSTAGSHWEAAIFQTEIMVGVSAGVQRQVLSNVTLGLAQDSGWYEPNFAAAGFLRYGHNAGCDMLQACGAPVDSPAQQYFCEAAGAAGSGAANCINHENTAWCKATPLSSQCPILQRFSNGDCKDKANVQLQFGGADVSDIGIHYGPSAICIDVPGGRLTRDGTGRIYTLDVTCMASQCRDDGLYLLIKDVASDNYAPYPCPAGGFVTPGADAGFPAGTRFGPCPPEDEVCPYKGCPVTNERLCGGQGNCYQGKCYCSVDHAGYACGERVCGSSADCADGEFCTDAGECSDGEPPPPPPPRDALPIVSNTPDDSIVPMRALRIGYMESCLAFLDANKNGAPDLQEEAQPTSSTGGAITLFPPNGAKTTSAPVRLDASPRSQCDDSLSGRSNPFVILTAAQGIPTEGSTINVFSTTTLLLLQREAGLSRAEGAPRVARAFGIPVGAVHTTDWVARMVDSSASSGDRASAMNVGESAVATVVTAEQVAAYVGGDERAAAIAAANAFLLQMLDGAAGAPMERLQDRAWLSETVAALAAGEAAEGADAALVDTLLLVNGHVAAAKELASEGDTAAALAEWAKVAHVAEGDFARNASALASGAATPAQYSAATTEARLQAGKDAYDVDLSEAAPLEDPGFFEDVGSKVKDWITSEHAGLVGWAWVLIGGVPLLLLLCLACSCCGTRRQRRHAKRVEAREAAVTKQQRSGAGRANHGGARRGGGGNGRVPDPLARPVPVGERASFGSAGAGVDLMAPPPSVGHGGERSSSGAGPSRSARPPEHRPTGRRTGGGAVSGNGRRERHARDAYVAHDVGPPQAGPRGRPWGAAFTLDEPAAPPPAAGGQDEFYAVQPPQRGRGRREGGATDGRAFEDAYDELNAFRSSRAGGHPEITPL